jgi:gamma-glutamyltranspeptidase/glutathione hydrolase
LVAEAGHESEQTTHLSVVDAEGSAVSCSLTLSRGFGARYVAPSTGVVMNNSLAAFGRVGKNVPTPGQAMHSSMAPTIVSNASGVVAVLGSPGGDTIPSTVVQVLQSLVDHRLPLDEAVESARVHHGLMPDELRYEARRPPPRSVLAALASRGHRLAPRQAPIGDANSIVIAGGVASGHADTREGGLAAGPEASHSGAAGAASGAATGN